MSEGEFGSLLDRFLSNYTSKHQVDVNDEQCSICFENYMQGEYATKINNCKHFFHRQCIQKWFTSGQTVKCPICKQHADEGKCNIELE